MAIAGPEESWDLKRAAEGSEGDAPRKLSAAELEAMRSAVTSRLLGLTIPPDLEVPYSLMTCCVAMCDNSRWRHVPWEVCTTMSLDIIGHSKDDTWVRDPETVCIKAETADTRDKADVASDLKVDFAFRRRGLALEMADLGSRTISIRTNEHLGPRTADRLSAGQRGPDKEGGRGGLDGVG